MGEQAEVDARDTVLSPEELLQFSLFGPSLDHLSHIRYIESVLCKGCHVPSALLNTTGEYTMMANGTSVIRPVAIPSQIQNEISLFFNALPTELKPAGVTTVLSRLRQMLLAPDNPEKQFVITRDELLRAYLSPALSADADTVRSSLRQFLTPGIPADRGLAQSIFREEAISLRVHNKTIGKRFSYYGIKVSLNDLPDGDHTATELNRGLLAIHAADGTPAGLLDLRAELPNLKISDANKSIIPLDRAAVVLGIHDGPQAVAAFLRTQPDFFDEQSWHTNDVPPAAQYTLWQVLTMPTESNLRKNTQALIDRFGTDAWVFIHALDGDGQRLSDFLSSLDTLTKLKASPLITASHLHDLQNAESRVKSLAPAVSQDTGWAKEALDHLASTGKSEYPVEQYRQLFYRRYQTMMHETIQTIIDGVGEIRQEVYSGKTRRAISAKINMLISGINFHLAGTASLAETLGHIAEDAAGIPHTVYQFSPDSLNQLINMEGTLPSARETSHAIMTLWFIRAVRNQMTTYHAKNAKELCNRRNAFLDKFYEHYVAIEGHAHPQAYADTGDLEQTRLARAIKTLFNRKMIPPGHRSCSLAVGDGLRVDARAHAILWQLAEQTEPGVLPSEIVGIDMTMLPETQRWRAMRFVHGRIEQIPQDHPDLLRKFHLVGAYGSPFNNMDLLPMQAIYFIIARQLLAPSQSVLLYETASDLPFQNLNLRKKTMNAFLADFPWKPYGSQGINPAYRSDSYNPPHDETGAFIYSFPVFRYLAHIAGLQLISPPEDPKELVAIMRKYQNSAHLTTDTMNDSNAVTQPFYETNPGKTKRGKIARVMYTMTPAGEPSVDPLLNPFLRPFLEAYQIKAGIRWQE